MFAQFKFDFDSKYTYVHWATKKTTHLTCIIEPRNLRTYHVTIATIFIKQLCIQNINATNVVVMSIYSYHWKDFFDLLIKYPF